MRLVLTDGVIPMVLSSATDSSVFQVKNQTTQHFQSVKKNIVGKNLKKKKESSGVELKSHGWGNVRREVY